MNAPSTAPDVEKLLDHAAHWLAHTVTQRGQRTDGWSNPLTGFGTTRDKTTYGEYSGFTELPDGALETLYHGDDLAQRMIDTEPEEMLRKGYILNIGEEGQRAEDLEAAICEQLEELGANEKCVEAMCWGDLYGGAVIVLGADDGRPMNLPLMPERARKLDFLEVVDRRFLSVNSYYQAGPKIGQPETYSLGNPTPVTRPVNVIHESRLILFGGAPRIMGSLEADASFGGVTDVRHGLQSC
jgi:hypothetical protein